MWHYHSHSLPSLVSLLPTPLPLFCLKLIIGLFSALTPPPFPFLFLSSAINCIQDYYYLIWSLLYIWIGVTFLCVARGYLFMSSILCCKAPYGNFLERTLYTFWYYYYYYYVNNKNNNGTLLSEFSTCITLCMKGVKINVRESWRGNREWIIQRNWQQGAHKTLNEEKTKTKQTKHNYRDSYRPLH